MKSSTLFQSAAIIAALFSSAIASAGVPDSPPTGVVTFADLNLNTPAGVRVLYRRIRSMADRVCELPRETRQLRSWTELRSCRASATERAVRLVNLPALDDLHLASTEPRATPVQVTNAR